jgi:hypothetical protein
MSGYRPFLEGPFRLHMGLRALEPADWIERGDDFASQLERRRRLLDERHGEVFGALRESLAGQAETLRLLLEHLLRHFPDAYADEGGEVVNRATDERFAPAGFADRPLELAGRLVQEDLCLMQESEAGYRLVAAVLCFPSRWRLRDKLGRPLDAIHEPVPGFDQRLAAPVGRFFARLDVGRPVWRVNWSLIDTPELFLLPEHRTRVCDLTPEDAGERLWLRVERQTLRRLPATGDVLFTIRTHVERLVEVLDEPASAAALAARVREMPDAIARYKSIAPVRGPLLAWLERRAATQAAEPQEAIAQGPNTGG